MMTKQIVIEVLTTPREYQALQAAWGDKIKMQPQWNGLYANEWTQVYLRCEGPRIELQSMVAALGLTVSDDGALYIGQPSANYLKQSECRMGLSGPDEVVATVGVQKTPKRRRKPTGDERHSRVCPHGFWTRALCSRCDYTL